MNKEEKKKKPFFVMKNEKRDEKHESEVTLIWATLNFLLSTEASKIELSQEEIVLFVFFKGTSGPFFALFWRLLGRLEKEKKKKTKMEKMKNGKIKEK